MEVLNGGRFLDWPTSTDPKAVHAGLQAMMIMTFEAGSEIMEALNRSDLEKKYKKISKRLKKHKPEGNTSKQAASLMVLADISKAKKTNKEILSKDGVKNMSTFYGYYILEAMAKANDYDNALNVIRDYWGGMLDLGATTFWEDFNIEEVDESTGFKVKDMIVGIIKDGKLKMISLYNVNRKVFKEKKPIEVIIYRDGYFLKKTLKTTNQTYEKYTTKGDKIHFL